MNPERRRGADEPVPCRGTTRSTWTKQFYWATDHLCALEITRPG